MKNYKKHIFFLDRYPFIVLILVLTIGAFLFLVIRNNLPLGFFSESVVKEEKSESYTIFIASPSNNQTFNFVNQNEVVPIEIKAKEIENLEYIIKVIINDREVKTFSSPPYKYNWNPQQSGEYEIVAYIVDQNEQIISTSNKVNILVKYEEEELQQEPTNINVEEKKNKILSQARYRSQNGAPIFSYKCYIPPVIDGSIEEWAKFEKFSSFVPTIKKENYTSHTDISATFYSCWDENNFYFAVQVGDDVFNQPYTGNQLNKGDSISIVFDTDLQGDMHIPFLTGDDCQIDFSPGNFSTTVPEAFLRWPANAPPTGVNIRSTRLSNGYLIEVSIPWYNLVNYTPKDEDILGFTISVLDTDNLESTELVISSSNQFDFNNTFTLGTLILIDVGNIQEEETP